MTDVFQALAAPARRAILDELQERDGQTLFELCTRLTMNRGFEMSRQAISPHLNVLEAAGHVRTEREGRYKGVRCAPRAYEEMAEWQREAGLAPQSPSAFVRYREPDSRSRSSRGELFT